MKDTLHIEKLGENDLHLFIALLTVFEEVFEMKDFRMPEHDYLSGLLQEKNFHVFVGMADSRVIGGLTAYALQSYYTRGAYLYIYDLAVATAFQRQGIGSRLMSAVIQSCKNTFIQEVFVQADMVDDYAVDFYRSTGGREENAVMFSYQL